MFEAKAEAKAFKQNFGLKDLTSLARNHHNRRQQNRED